jgi:hypothetical protein
LPRVLLRRNFSKTTWRPREALPKFRRKEPGTGPRLIYPEQITVYKAFQGTTFNVVFLKCVSLFGCAVGYFYFAGPYIREKEPHTWDEFFELVASISAFAALVALNVYCTAPFVKTIKIKLPPYARRSRAVLMRFASNLPPDTRLDITTLRVIPFRRTDTVFITELQSLPRTFFNSIRWFSNLKRIKTDAWKERHRQKSTWAKWVAFMNEPRWRFSTSRVNEAKDAPGMWEIIMDGLKERTARIEAEQARKLRKKI